MQSNKLKIILVIFSSLFLHNLHSSAQVFRRDLEVADSLFVEKKFTEAFDIYEAIYETGEHASAAMLLKMAYIREGLGDPSGAMYYLNTYYLKTKNEKALDKMDNLAEAHQLMGYDVSEGSRLINYYYRYIDQVLVALLIVVVGLFASLIIVKIKKGNFSYGLGSGLIVFAGILFYLVNYTLDYDKGIFIGDTTYIMSAPSAGADVIGVQTAGHRVEILGQEDVWVRILWEEQEAYIKEAHIKRLYF